jgi:hypothetical protein
MSRLFFIWILEFGMTNKLSKLIILFCLVMGIKAFSYTIRVNQAGSDFLGTTYTTIQAAVNACSPADGCDSIMVTDSSVYNEQVTFDSTKANITLFSLFPESPATILYKDVDRVHPKSGAEAQNMNQWFDQDLQYDLNGTVRMIFASNITIRDMIIDGGERYGYGWGGVWGGMYPLLGGNVGVLIRNSKGIIIENCELRNSWYGVYLKGRNLGGQNANINPDDLDGSSNIPLSGYGKAGSALIQYNRIYDNTYAFFGESEWDIGSTIRYNLIYDNYARTGERPAADSQGEESGGVFKLKDVTLAVYQFYNNTMFRNYYDYHNNWKGGNQHLPYNNIWATPTSPADWDYGEVHALMNRTTHSVLVYRNKQAISLQNQTNANVNNNWVTLDEPIVGTYNFNASTSSGKFWESVNFIKGGQTTVLVNGASFPFTVTDYFLLPTKHAQAPNTWMTTTPIDFLSTDRDDPNFLCPNWDNPYNVMMLLDQGRSDVGLSDWDGSPPDIGALSKGPLNNCRWRRDMNAPQLVLRALGPILKSGTNGILQFTVDVRNGDPSRLTNLSFYLAELTTDLPVETGDARSEFTTPYPTPQKLSFTAVLRAGANLVTVPIPLGLTDYANLDVVVKGDLGADTYYSNLETFQYRGASTGTATNPVQRSVNFKVGFTDRDGNAITSAKAGQVVKVVLEAVDFDGNPIASPSFSQITTSTFIGNRAVPSFWSVNDPTFGLPGGPSFADLNKTGNPTSTSLTAFVGANYLFSSTGSEALCVSGVIGNVAQKNVAFGCGALDILPGSAVNLRLINPESSMGKGPNHVANVGRGIGTVRVLLLDEFGNPAAFDSTQHLVLQSANQAVALNAGPVMGANREGVVEIRTEFVGDFDEMTKIEVRFDPTKTQYPVAYDFSNIKIAIPDFAVRMVPDSLSDIVAPSGSCVPMPLGLFDADNVIQVYEQEFVITPSSGLTFYRDNNCETPVVGQERIRTRESGLITLYVSGVDISNGTFETFLSNNPLARAPHEKRITFFSPDIFFTDKDGNILASSDMGIEEFMFVPFPLYVAAYFEGNLCLTCNQDVIFEMDENYFAIRNLAEEEVTSVKLTNGVASVMAFGVNQIEAGQILVKSGGRSHIYTPIKITESPVPYILSDGARMKDSNGDGIADMLTLKFHRAFDSDTLPIKIAFRWPETGEYLEAPGSIVIPGTDSVTITPEIVSNARTNQLAAGVNTRGPGSVNVHWSRTIIGTDFLTQSIRDYMGPIIISADVVLSNLFDEVTLTLSEDLLVSSIDPKAMLLAYQRGDEPISYHIPFAIDYPGPSVMRLRFNKDLDPTQKPVSGDYVRIHFDPALVGLIVDRQSNHAHVDNPWVEIIGKRRIRVETSRFYDGAVSELKPSFKAGDEFKVMDVGTNDTLVVLERTHGLQGFFVPYAIFQNATKDQNNTTADPANITLVFEIDIYTSLGGHVTSKTLNIRCDDQSLFAGSDCLTARKAIFIGWNHRDMNGRAMGTGVYVVNYQYQLKNASAKVANSGDSVLERWGYHRREK